MLSKVSIHLSLQRKIIREDIRFSKTRKNRWSDFKLFTKIFNVPTKYEFNVGVLKSNVGLLKVNEENPNSS